ncbi:helix-turn-helix domain-containing protein [Duganella sp. FT92W]|uniref:Helix-turn-helix domain-containing protein n=1 Tax=Pseudoduganella rivuli TaxID=2666085 RepID=A0A7X2IVC4_9BURK|nr:AraC family transcriptional regulator [Pseudoduganella rivuli]MRV76776.1 helix-turn-helix domain-containing protein [Pseudoduganella rivuli]
MISCVDDLQQWFRQSGVDALHACIGPLPTSGAALGRWTSDGPAQIIRSVSPHPGSYRLALMMEPLDARIWHGNTPVWGGTIPASRFRLCPPGEQGRWSQLSGCDIVNVFIPIALVDQLAMRRGDETGAVLTANKFVSDRTVLDMVRRMLDARALAGPLAPDLCDHTVMTLVCYLLEHYSKPDHALDGGLSGARLRRVLRHIAEHADAPPSNGELAALCGMSAAHFSREFHRAVGVPPHRYVQERRLEQAAGALVGSDARITDIAQEVGFQSASHFTRAFSAQYGMSPAAWRSTRKNPAPSTP